MVTSSPILAATVRAAPQVAASALAAVPALSLSAAADAPVLAPAWPGSPGDVGAPATPAPAEVHSDRDTQEKLKIMREQAQTLQDEQLRQAKLTFNVAVGLLVLGVLIIFAGTAVILYKEKTNVGTLTAAGGAVADVISLILFRFHKVTNDKLDSLRTELNKIESAQFSMTLIEKITDPKERNDAIREVVRKLGAS